MEPAGVTGSTVRQTLRARVHAADAVRSAAPAGSGRLLWPPVRAGCRRCPDVEVAPLSPGRSQSLVRPRPAGPRPTQPLSGPPSWVWAVPASASPPDAPSCV